MFYYEDSVGLGDYQKTKQGRVRKDQIKSFAVRSVDLTRVQVTLSELCGVKVFVVGPPTTVNRLPHPPGCKNSPRQKKLICKSWGCQVG